MSTVTAIRPVVHDLAQGSAEWTAFRSPRFGGSEAAAMLGLSPYTTRSELLRLKHLGVGKEVSDWFQEHVLDHGHRVEAAIRSHVEALIDDDLSPITCSRPDSNLVASCDGLTLAGDTAWENKQWNAELAAAVASGVVPDTHMPQCQQILLVSAAQRLLFTVTDGTPERFESTWVEPDPAWFERIVRGWAQFEHDLVGYEPPAAVPTVVAAAQEHLPAISVQVQGGLTIASNLDAFGVALRAFVERIPTMPSTDQEFADTAAACKRLQEAEDRLAQAEDSALASMSNVEQMRRAVADLRDLARSTRLASEKLVARRKEQIREDEVWRGRAAVDQHLAALGQRIGMPMPPLAGDFGAVIKGLKNLDSLRNAIDTEVARVKTVATAMADRMEVNLQTIDGAGEGLRRLFADRAALAVKDPEAVSAIVAQRVADHLASEAALVAEAEQRARDEASRPAAAQQAAAIVTAATPASITTPAIVAPTADPLVKLGDINAWMGCTVNAAFVSNTLGVPGARDKAATLFPRKAVRDALVRHLQWLET